MAAIQLLTTREVCERLRVSRDTFDRHWRDRFSPRTCAGTSPGPRSPRVYLSDEVDVAVEGGREALELYRRKRGRLRDAA